MEEISVENQYIIDFSTQALCLRMLYANVVCVKICKNIYRNEDYYEKNGKCRANGFVPDT